jgi:hypothetical protein
VIYEQLEQATERSRLTTLFLKKGGKTMITTITTEDGTHKDQLSADLLAFLRE